MPLRRSHLLIIAVILATVLVGLPFLRPTPAPPIRVGVLHSMSGTMAVSERPLVDAVRLSVEEINAAGGLPGRQVEMAVADGRPHNEVFDADFDAIIAEIGALKPDAMLNTINGDSNTHFFRALHAAGLGTVPVMSFSLAEVGLQAFGANAFHPNHYAAWSYVQSLPGEANRRFVAAFQKRYGANRVTNDPIEAAYVAVQLWAQSMRRTLTDAPQQVNRAPLLQTTAAPSGVAAVDRDTRHLWKGVHIGKARAYSQFDLVWDSGVSLRPTPYPGYRSQREWQRLAAERFGATR